MCTYCSNLWCKLSCWTVLSKPVDLVETLTTLLCVYVLCAAIDFRPTIQLDIHHHGFFVICSVKLLPRSNDLVTHYYYCCSISLRRRWSDIDFRQLSLPHVIADLETYRNQLFYSISYLKSGSSSPYKKNIMIAPTKTTKSSSFEIFAWRNDSVEHNYEWRIKFQP